MSDIEKIHGITPDLTRENVDRLLALFPDVATETTDPKTGRTERTVDFDALRERLGDVAEGNRERYQFTWPGKREAKRLAREPIAKTLRPVKERSKDWDTTRNLYIEGDNLDALKLLRENYAGKVKLIYIDPPYNTGHDFIYKDNFGKTVAADKSESGDYDDEGGQLVANPESNGRFHSNWCSMIYPRLMLARDLLTSDGTILISIDDHEAMNLKKICDEIFGLESFCAQLVWKSRQNKDNRSVTGVSIDHEYILMYSKSPDKRVFRGADRLKNAYKNPDNDSRGPWQSANMVGLATEDARPNLHYDLINPETGINYGKPERGWRYDQKTMSRLIKEDKIIWPSSPDGRPRRKKFLSELTNDLAGFSSIIGDGIYTRNGSLEIRQLFNGQVFDFPKPSQLIQQLIDQGTSDEDIILDFFSGSASTAVATLNQNAVGNGHRKFILIQMPEAVGENSEAAKAGYSTICEIGEERIRRAGEKIKSEIEAKNAQVTLDVTPKKVPDIGFRVLRVDDSNYVDRRKSVGTWSQQNIDADVNISKPDRSDLDLLFEALPKFQLQYDAKIDTLSGGEFDGHTVYNVNDGQLLACFEPDIPESLIRTLAAFRPRPSYVLVSERSFPDSAACTNFVEIFKQSADSVSGGTQIRII